MLVAIKMATPAEKEKQLLRDTSTIILFYSNGCGHCVNYKNDSWPKLVRAAKDHANIREIDVSNPQDQKFMKYHLQNGVPNTVFLGKQNNILYSNPGNFDTSRLVKAFESMKPKFGYQSTYRLQNNI